MSGVYCELIRGNHAGQVCMAMRNRERDVCVPYKQRGCCTNLQYTADRFVRRNGSTISRRTRRLSHGLSVVSPMYIGGVLQLPVHSLPETQYNTIQYNTIELIPSGGTIIYASPRKLKHHITQHKVISVVSPTIAQFNTLASCGVCNLF